MAESRRNSSVARSRKFLTRRLPAQYKTSLAVLATFEYHRAIVSVAKLNKYKTKKKKNILGKTPHRRFLDIAAACPRDH